MPCKGKGKKPPKKDYLKATYYLHREYERTHPGKKTMLTADYFEIDDIWMLLHDIDAFSIKQGWMQG